MAGIAAAISGGGHRAALFGLGTLLYLADRDITFVPRAPDPGAIAKLVGKDMASLLEAAQAAAEVRSRAQAVRDTIVALLTELTRS